MLNANRMNQFRIVMRFHFVNAFMNKNYVNMKAMFEITKKIKNQKNNLNNKYSRSDNKNKKKNREQINQEDDVKLFIANKTNQNRRSEENKSSNERLNAQIESISIKSTSWMKAWYESEKNSKKLNIEKQKNMLIKQKRCWSCSKSDHKKNWFNVCQFWTTQKIQHHDCRDWSDRTRFEIRHRVEKKIILDQNRDQESSENDLLKEVKIFSHAIRDLLISRIKKKHFVIKINIIENKNLSLIDNESEIELINETFAQFNNLKLINLKKKNRIRLMLSDEKVVQILNKTTKVKIKTENHRERFFC
jgi:hypothetical protein